MIREDITRWLDASGQLSASSEVVAPVTTVIKPLEVVVDGALQGVGLLPTTVDVSELRRDLDSMRVQMAMVEQSARLSVLEAVSRTPNVLPKRRGGALAVGALVLLLAAGTVVGIRAHELSQQQHTAAGADDNGNATPTLPDVLPGGNDQAGTAMPNTTVPVYALANTAASSNVGAAFSVDIFKPSVEIPEADMIGGVDPNGALNPDSLGFVAKDTIFDFTLQDAETKNIPACGGDIIGAAYEVTAHNSFGPLGDDALRSALTSLTKPEQIKMLQGLYNVADQATLTRAIGSSYLILFDGSHNELIEVNGCTELINE